MITPFLSIILPVYNVAPYLMRCINSLLALNIPHEEVEIIFVDDCSPDDSVYIIEKIMQNYSHFCLIRHKANKRAGGARNTGLRAAKGTYVFFCDPDDEILPLGMEAAVSHVKNSNKRLDVAMFDSIQPGGDMMYTSNRNDIMDAQDFLKKNNVTWSPCISLYRKEYLTDNNIYFAENVLFEDIDWVLRAQSYAQTIQYQPIAIYKYYTNDISQSNTRPNVIKVTCWLEMALRINKLAEEQKNEIGKILRAHSQLALKRGFYSLCFLSYVDRQIVVQNIKTIETGVFPKGGVKCLMSYPIINRLISLIHPLFLIYDLIRNRKSYQ